jgi:hypothetical protein
MAKNTKLPLNYQMAQNTKWPKIPNGQKYQIAIIYSKWPTFSFPQN